MKVNQEETTLIGLVFVKRKHSAFALHKYIEELCIWDMDMYFIRSTYMIGQYTVINSLIGHYTCCNQPIYWSVCCNQLSDWSIFCATWSTVPCHLVRRHVIGWYVLTVGADADEEKNDMMKSKKQDQKLLQFRQRKINLLVGTQLLHSDIDLPKCNLIAMFDPPGSYRDYIKSKVGAAEFLVLPNDTNPINDVWPNNSLTMYFLYAADCSVETTSFNSFPLPVQDI